LRLSVLIVAFIFSCIASPLYSQDTNDNFEVKLSRKHLLDLSFDTYVPLNFYRKQLDANGYGGSIAHFVQIFRESPIFLGYSLGLRQFQYRSLTFEDFVDQQIVEFKESLGMNYMQFNGAFRYYLPLPWYTFQVFLQGELGYLASYSVYKVEDVELGETTDWKLENWDGALMYQLSGGFNIPLGENVYLKLELGYLYSNSHTFLASDISNKQTLGLVRDYFTEKKAPFEAFTNKIGVTFAF
jgi:hypothetical protein